MNTPLCDAMFAAYGIPIGDKPEAMKVREMEISFAEAADEIERLTRELASTKHNSSVTMDELGEMREERDEARSALSEGAARWIPVEERVPESEIPTWVVTDTKRRLVAEFGDGEWWVWQGDGRKVTDYLENVTHWMPLPEAPK